MRNSLLVFCVFFLIEQVVFSNNIETFKLTSKVFKNTRTIRVLLPPKYGDPENLNQKYPVFYLNDGLMVFDPKEPGLMIEASVYELYKQKDLVPMIIVGIDNGACTDKTTDEIADRANEFLPYPDAGFSPNNTYEPVPPHTQGKLYPDFLINEVMPEIQKRYRTKVDPDSTALGGFSYGAVSALYTVIAKPGRFGKLMLESTPLWIGPEYELLRDAKNLKEWPAVVHIGSGTKENDEEAFSNEGKKNQERLAQIIKTKSPQTQIKFVRDEGAKHDTSAWRTRLPAALKFLFSTE